MIAAASDYKPAGWHNRGYLPHFDGGEVFQSITFRLYDSMPQELLAKWRAELARESEQFEDELRWRIEAYLDRVTALAILPMYALLPWSRTLCFTLMATATDYLRGS